MTMRENFHPAFDMPTTPEEALAVLTAWGNETTKTFRHDKARACAELLAEVTKPLFQQVSDYIDTKPLQDLLYAYEAALGEDDENATTQTRTALLEYLKPLIALQRANEHCQCEACRDGTIHASDCAVHNEPAYPKGPCNCDAGKVSDAVALAFHNAISDSPINVDEMAELKVGLKAALAIARQEQTRK